MALVALALVVMVGGGPLLSRACVRIWVWGLLTLSCKKQYINCCFKRFVDSKKKESRKENKVAGSISFEVTS